MLTIDIQRWDAVIPSGGTFPLPMLYIKPTPELESIAKTNKYTVLVTVVGTNSIYDNKQFAGIIDSSAYYPNFRPNFYNENHWWTITLAANWNGYPFSLGKVQIVGPDSVQTELASIPYTPPAVIEWYSSNNKPLNLPVKSTMLGNVKNFLQPAQGLFLLTAIAGIIVGGLAIKYNKL
jgi:hypothetical protein